MSEALDRAVSTVIRECLCLEPSEEVLVICNPITEELGALFRINAQGEGGDATLAVISERESHAAEPPAAVAAAMMAADIVIAPTIQSISHTEARKAATEAGARTASMPGATSEMLARVMGADMRLLRKRGAELARVLGAGAEARITCPRGSDLRMGLQDRTAIVDAGMLNKRGAFGNIPCGEAFVAPVEGTGEGSLVVDGSIAAIGKLSSPVHLELQKGHLTSANGPEGERFMEMLTDAGPQGTNLAELGIGTNEEAILTGNILEDEKILGSIHVAFGASAAIGGTVQVPVHLDCVVLEPTVEIDGETVLQANKLAV
ncbi:MAG TPA: aminopeptidase [Solirubrobacterales bacterium]|jgi:leucyl aminopeptidase (aminopeptidase T)|nr:aminopeptidase [Solirubrobacterales bacterium]